MITDKEIEECFLRKTAYWSMTELAPLGFIFPQKALSVEEIANLITPQINRLTDEEMSTITFLMMAEGFHPNSPAMKMMRLACQKRGLDVRQEPNRAAVP